MRVGLVKSYASSPKYVDQELRLQLDRVGSTAAPVVAEHVQLQLERAQEATRSPDAALHEERLHDERLQLERLRSAELSDIIMAAAGFGVRPWLAASLLPFTVAALLMSISPLPSRLRCS